MENKKSFDTLNEAYSYIDANNINKYKITLCRYPDMAFYIVEWE